MPRLFARIVIALSLLIAVVAARAQSATPPTIASISKSQTVVEGVSVALSVSVNGTAPFTYQWRKDGAAVAGATNSTYSIDPVRVADAGSYTVDIGNAAGSASGGPILLAVNPATAPSFSYQPSDVTVTIGQSISIYLSVSGTSPMTYQWKKDGSPIPLPTGSSFYKGAAEQSDAGSYTVTVTNVAGATTSNAFTVRVNPLQPPTVSLSDQTVSLGSSMYWYAHVSGYGTITCQWSKDGVPIPGATSDSYGKPNAQASDAGTYTVTATNAAGSGSASARLTIRPGVGPSIYSSPSSVTVTAGQSFYLSLGVSGSDPMSYKWYKDGAAISGATSSSYSKSNAQASDAGAYYAVVSNAQGSATSSTALVTVTNAQAPVITSMTSMITVRQGEYLSSISAGITSTGTVTYQWSKDGVAISGAVGSSLQFYRSAASSDAGVYTVVVTGLSGSVASPACKLVVLPPLGPTITVQPSSRTIRQGESATFSGSTNGTSPFVYQWKKDGVAIPGATGSEYSIARVASSDAGAYSFTVSNASGTATSDQAALTVLPGKPPRIDYCPASMALLPGDTLSMYVSVSSTTPCTYQWYRNGTPVPGAMSSYLYLSGQPSEAGSYTVVATNAAGSTTSHESTIVVQATRPVITYASGGRTVTGGSSVSLEVKTSGTNETVQWFKDGVAIPNATTKTYSFSNFVLTSAGVYTAQVTSGGLTYTSWPVVLDLAEPTAAPIIRESPHSIAAKIGSSTAFSVQAEGEAPLTYVWKKDGVAISGQTSSSYYFTTAASSVGTYTVEVSNKNGSVTSAAARYTILTDVGAPVITRGPYSQTLTQGSSLSMSADVQSISTVRYQWYKNGAAITGGTDQQLYYYISAKPEHAGRYYVVATNSVGSTTSEEAVVTVNASANGPSFTTQPASITVYRGSPVGLTAAATGNGTVSYQWRKDGVAIPGATGATLTLTNVQDADTGTYTVVATDSVASVSSMPAVVTVSGGVQPAIVTSPVSTTAVAGGTVTLTGLASGIPPPTYQWKHDGNALVGMTSATLTLTNVKSSDAGKYSFVATNVIGAVTSSEATVTVLASAPAISGQPQGGTYAAGSTVVLKVTASGSGTLTYQWYRNGWLIVGATGDTLTFSKIGTEQAGTYKVVVSNGTSTVTSQSVVISVSGMPFAGIYFGKTAEGHSWALHVSSGGVGTFLAYLKSRGLAIIANDVTIKADGTFQFGTAPGIAAAASSGFSRFLYTGQVTGSISNGSVTGRLTGLAVDFSGTQSTADTGLVSGYFRAVSYETNISELHAISTRSGLTLAVGVDALGARGAETVATIESRFQIESNSYRYVGQMAPGGGFTATMQMPSGESLALVTPAPQGGVERLVDVSTRGLSGSSGARMLTAGFFIQGTAPKKLLIRAVGPGLRPYGVTENLMENPRVKLLKGETLVTQNDDWGADAGSYFAQCGAFGLTPGSKDAAMVTTLDPGLYSAQVFSDTPETNGIALVEVYDIESSTGPKLINISTRGYVDGGSSILIAGVAVTGNAPKKVLIRAVGPRLKDFGVGEALADPKLTIFKGQTPLISNDNWGDAVDPDGLANAAAGAGGFDLKQGSKDSALLMYLAPGNYTAQVSGADGGTGIALVEVYEVQ